MKSITIKGSQRESVGKKSSKALRNAGKIPCVVYGGETPVHFSADEMLFKDLVYTPNAHTVVIEFENGDTIQAVMQDIQFHPVSDSIMHVDFYQLFSDKPVTMAIPVRLNGNAPGVRNGGRLLFRNRKLTIRALPEDLPDFFDIDISGLKIGDLISVESVKKDAFTILHPDSTVIVQVKTSRTVIEVTEEEDEGEGQGAEEVAAEAPAEEGNE